MSSPTSKQNGFNFLRRRVAPTFFSALLLLGGSLIPSTRAQEPVETIRVRTRVVFMDALVKEKRTGIPISDLKPENFEVLDDSKPRAISYFTREGQARKPLAMIIILDCREDGAGRFLKRPEILKAMTDELAKLPPGDEVAIMAMNIGEDERRLWLTHLTSDRGEIAGALAKVPQFVEHPDLAPDEAARAKEGKPAEKSSSGSLTVTSDNAKSKPEADKKPAASQNPNEVPIEDIASVEIIKGKNGAVVTRTTMKDGTINLKRVSGSGHVIMQMNDVYDMAAAVREASDSSIRERPNSQPAVVWVSDGIAPIFFEDREATEEILMRNNVIFNSLTVELRTLFKFLLPIGKPIAGWMGVSLYGSAKRLAQQSGGEAVKVGRVSDYGSGLARIIGNLTARYSLGFQISEDEKDDGRMHALDVRVKAVDAKGKQRKLVVSARKGYYMPTEKQAASASSN